MRKYVIKALEIVNGFLLLMALYCSIAILGGEVRIDTGLRSLIWLPMIASYSVLSRKLSKIWQYIGLTVLWLAVGYHLSGRLYLQIAACVGVLMVAWSYFRARTEDETCWLDEPRYPWLAVFFITYMLAVYKGCSWLQTAAVVYAGCYFLVYNYYTNLTQMEAFVKRYANLERLPVGRMGKINQGMLGILSGATVVAMCIFPFLKMDELILKAGEYLRRLIVWILRLIFSGGGETEIVETETVSQEMQQVLPEAAESTGLFWVILYKVLEVLSWIAFTCFALFALWNLLKKLYTLYCKFHENTVENGDYIERIIAEPSRQEKKRLAKEQERSLFWDRSCDGRIRKHYKRRVQKDRKEPPMEAWTPAQIEEHLNIPEEHRNYFHTCYEKARYANEECSREELQKMLEIH